MKSCRLCKRDCAPSSTLCKYHLTAKRNIESGYKVWREAYGDFTMKEYLQKIGRTPETGEWAKEVAELMSRETIE
jgi:nucleoid DNA-binding protein